MVTKQTLASIEYAPINARAERGHIATATDQNALERSLYRNETSAIKFHFEPDGDIEYIYNHRAQSEEDTYCQISTSQPPYSAPTQNKFDPVRRYLLHNEKQMRASTKQPDSSTPTRNEIDPARRYVLTPGKTMAPPPRRFYGLWWRGVALAAVADARAANMARARAERAAPRTPRLAAA